MLEEIFSEGKYADRAIASKLKQNRKWGSRDRRFIASNAYEIVRYYRLYSEISKSYEQNFWNILGIHFILKFNELPNFEEFAQLDTNDILEKYETVKDEPKIKESIPDWLDELGKEELGEKWVPTLCALNEPAKVVLRVNTLKTKQEELRKY